jgi:pyruvate/2-oxoglutarate dehydrogenase complex dihydrolipoamide dehydrogenase (E3) component
MTNLIQTDICVIGAGSGGLSVAAGASQMGADVVLIEKGAMGGDCLNTGCVPSKAMLAAAEKAQALREAGSNGIVYPSVRHKGGQCLAAFYPDVASIPVQTKHVALKWNGERISKWFDYETEEWSVL